MKEIYLFRDAHTHEIKASFDDETVLKLFLKGWIENSGFESVREYFAGNNDEIASVRVCDSFEEYMDYDDDTFSEKTVNPVIFMDGIHITSPRQRNLGSINGDIEFDSDYDEEGSAMDGCPDFDDHSGDEVEDEYDPKKHIKYTEEEEEAFAIADALEVLDALGDNDE